MIVRCPKKICISVIRSGVEGTTVLCMYYTLLKKQDLTADATLSWGGNSNPNHMNPTHYLRVCT